MKSRLTCAKSPLLAMSGGILLFFWHAFVYGAEKIKTPDAPDPFADYEVLNYTKRVVADTTSRTSAKGPVNRAAVAGADTVETWVVRSADEPTSTYAVRRTTASDGDFTLCAYSPNRVLAWLAPGQDHAAFAREMESNGFRIVRQLTTDSQGNPIYIVESDDTVTDNVEVMAAAVTNTMMCANVTLNYIFDVTSTPNDPRFSEQYGLAMIGAQQAWETRTDASSVLVAVLDTGINHNHVDLRGNVWVNEGEIPDDNIDNDGNGVTNDIFGISCIKGIISGNPMDDNGHGTHCTGIIGAEGGNNVLGSGVAWKARIMGLKFVGSSGKNAETIDAVSCLDYADKMGVKIVNCSFGWDNQWDDCLHEQIKKMCAKGVIFVCAAGNARSGRSPKNTDDTPFYPASWNTGVGGLGTVVSVAATDANDELANYSYYGGNSVDIAAPGTDVYSTYHGSTGMEYLSGTSMATPHVVGALALLWAHYPDESATNIIERLYAAAEPLESLQGKVKGGRRLSMAGFFGIPAPDEIYVSQGTEAGAVVVYWAASKNATYYRVWRAETADGPKTMLRDWSQSLTFSDEEIAPGVTNWYFLQAATSTSGASASVFSEGIPGFRSSADTSRITVAFNPAGGTVEPSSKVYRIGEAYSELPTPSYPGKAFLGWHSAAVGGARIDAADIARRDVTTLFARWIDENALRIENLTALQRYPWNGLVDIDFVLHGVPNGASASVSLIASNPDGGDALSVETFVGASPTGLTNGIYHFIWNATPDTQNSLYPDLILNASISIDLLPAPSSGTATNNPATRAIEVSWSAVSGATSYQIWSGTTEDFNDAELLTTQGGTALTDLSATVGGQVYHYWIKTVSPGGVSADALHLSVTRASYEETGSMDACLYPFIRGWNNRAVLLAHQGNNTDPSALSPIFRFARGDRMVIHPCVGNLGDTTITELDFRAVCEDEAGNKIAENDSYIPLYEGGLEPGYCQVNLEFGMDSMQSLDPGNYTLYAAVDPDGKYGDVRPANNIAEYHFAILPETNVDFRTALDCPKMTFSAGANDANPPFVQTWKSLVGGSAVQFGPQNHSETNSLLATVIGPGTLTFRIWGDTESGHDNFEFLVDGARRTTTTGRFEDWMTRTFAISEGVHQLEWRYVKDFYNDGGHDIVYLDTVSWTPTETESLAPVTGLTATGTEAGVSLAWNAVGGASSYDVYSYRGEGTFNDAVLKGTTANTAFFDETTSPSAIPTYYWVRPRCTLGLGQASAAAQVLWMLPDLGFALPSELPWPSAVFLSSTNAPFVEKTSFVAGETILLHGCVGNYGNAAISNQYTILHKVTAVPSGETLSSLLVDCAGPTFMLASSGSGNVFAWDNATFTIPSTLPPGNYKYECILDSGSNVVEIDEGNNLCEIPFAVLRTASGGTEAIGLVVENSALAFTTGGDAEWEVVTTESYSGGSCAKSGAIDDGESTWMQTEVSGPGRLTFMVKASCEENFDKLAFLVDGVQKTFFSGIDSGWHEYGCDITGDSTHVLRWVFSKDPTVAKGDDCCWVDSVVWTPAAEPTFTISDGILTHVELKGTSDVVIPDGVTAIGNGVFEGTYVSSVKCPSSLRTIGVYAFHECTSLTNITFHAGLQTIEDWAFCGCSSLTGVFEIPEGVTDIAFGAFMVSGVSTLVFPSTLTHLGAQIVLNNPLVAVYFKGNAPQLDEVGTSAYPNEKSPYCSANANLVTYVPAGSTGWKDSTTALPATWPTYEGRPIQHYSGTPPRGTSGVVVGK